MKSLTVYTCIIFLTLFNLCLAQENKTSSTSLSYPTLEEKVTKSDLVIEGRVIAVKGFRLNHKGEVYTSAVIKITKAFKGAVADSVIELILDGGEADDLVVVASNALGLEKGMEGIFLLTDNKTEIGLIKDLKSYWPFYGERSYIGYHDETHMVAHHVATCKGVPYDDLEKDLFEPIEAVTGIPRKVLGPNMFERKAAQGTK